MTDEIDKRIAIDVVVAHVKRVAAQFGVIPERDTITAVYGLLEDMLPDGYGESPGELQRVECELIDYEPVAPYRIYIGDRDEVLDSTDYRAAQDWARHHSGARSVPVLIRDAKNAVTWEIRLRLTDTPLNGL